MFNEGEIMIGEQSYHVAVNWNTICGFLVATGNDSMSAIAEISNITPSQMPILIAEAIEEGERMKGNDVAIEPKQVGEKIDISQIGKFVQIFSNAMTPDVDKKKE